MGSQLTNVEEEPRSSSTKENLSMLPLGIVSAEIRPTSLRQARIILLRAHHSVSRGGGSGEAAAALEVGADIRLSFDVVPCDVEGESRSLWDGETEIESEDSRNTTDSNDDSPHFVNRKSAFTSAVRSIRSVEEGLLEAGSNNQSNHGSRKLTKTLHREDRTHHGTAPLGSRESGQCVSE